MLTREQAQAIYRAGEEAVVRVLLEMDARIHGASRAIHALEERVKALEAQVAMNSRNSSKPPSTDGFCKPAPKSLRPPSTRHAGGQPGHDGHTLRQVANPDRVVTHRAPACCHCGRDLRRAPRATVERRQVFELPPVRMEVTEHRVETIVCPHCHTLNNSAFPAGVAAPVQYGPRLKAVAVYLKDYQLIPYQRGAELFNDLFDCALSPGTLAQITTLCSQLLDEPVKAIKQRVISAPVVNYDETGCSVNGQRHWLHVACTPVATFFNVHPKRGAEATGDNGILPHFRGRAIHDFWQPYFTYTCAHGLCNAHHLRELTFVHEQLGQPWARRMIDCLLDMKSAVALAKPHAERLPDKQLDDLLSRYQLTLDEGYALNPRPAPLPRARRGRPRNTKAGNLLERLDLHRREVLAFLYDFSVPFDNNLAERDQRMMKVQQKISGTFRSMAGAKSFCRIRSYISTARKNALNAIEAITLAFDGHPFVPIIDTG